jgi:hypothetical protein
MLACSLALVLPAAGPVLAQGRRVLEVEAGAGVALRGGGRQFDFPGGFDTGSAAVGGALRWNAWQSGSLGVVVTRVAFGFSAERYVGDITNEGSRRMVSVALDIRRRLARRDAPLVPFISGQVGYVSQRFRQTFACTDEQQTTYWPCPSTIGDAGLLIGGGFGLAIPLRAGFSLEPAVTLALAEFGGLSWNAGADRASWLTVDVRLSAGLF